MLVLMRKLTQGLFALAVVVSTVWVVEGLVWAEAKPADFDEELLKEAGISSDANDLIDFLSRRSPEEVNPARIERLIRQLGSDDFNQREAATKELLRWGPVARKALQRAVADPDPEIAKRSTDCLKKITHDEGLALPLAVVRLLVKQRLEESVAPLLRYLPFTQDEEVEEEIYYALDALIGKQGKVPLALHEALKDKTAARRAVAACLIGRRGDVEAREAVKQLLDDPAPLVRLRAAQGLLAAKDKTGLPALIALLDEPDVALSWQAEELLHWAAGDTAPAEVVGAATEKERQKCRDAWQAWHQAHADKLDLVQRYSDARRPGLLLIVSRDDNSRPSEGKVWLRGCDGKPRWQLKPLYVGDAQLLPGNRVLLSEETAPEKRGVLERDLEGKVLWKAKTEATFTDHCYRLANGSTFIASKSYYPSKIVDAAGQVIMDYGSLISHLGADHLPRTNVPPVRLGNGRIAWVEEEKGFLGESDGVTGRIVKKVPFDPNVKVKSRPLYGVERGISQVAVLPSGHRLVSYMPDHPDKSDSGKPWERPRGLLVEVDRTGRVIWECPSVYWGEAATRLRNGQTVVYGYLGGVSGLVEVDRAGKKLWEDFPVSPPGLIVRLRLCLPLVRFGFDEPVTEVDFDAAEYRAKGLKDNDREGRYRALMFLQHLGPKAAPAAAALVEALADPDEKISYGAAEALVWIGRPALPAVLEALDHKRENVRAHAVVVLGRIKAEWQIPPEDAKPIVPRMLAALRDDSALVRRRAALSAGNFADTSEEIVAGLIRALDDKDVRPNLTEFSVAEAAMRSFWWQGRFAKPAVPALLEKVKAEDKRYREMAAAALGSIAAADRTVVPVILPQLLSLLQDKQNPENRLVPACAFHWMRGEAKPAVPALVEALKAKDVADPKLAKRIRMSIIGSLERIGPSAEAAVPALVTVLEDESRDIDERKDVARALGSIGPASIPALKEALKDKNRELREAAGRALQDMRR
jgi:HEAT repeat protein